MDHSHHHMSHEGMNGMAHNTATAMPSHSHSHGSSMGSGDDCSMDMMMMFFHTGHCETILFEGWRVTTIGGLIGSMIGIFFMAALYEGLKYYREYLFWRTYNALQYRSVSLPIEKNAPNDTQIMQPTMLSWIHAYQTCLHVVQIILSYFLMLIFMTYNVWLCVAVVFGAALGYFLFGWKKSVIVDVTEHCH